ncbi:serine hydrolase [Oceanobacillus sp. 143]|uniref:Serine hydrolase n=1 Tax=Oceanobacillus zhaokaii TaxID=2052660 RepID=A0A345PKT7_9BACI|nr:serine hydrolase [Oceanobacillus zhaokaii]AXI10617.1 serine hydrolase [Oceanobacillus zhaokaii]QGS69603.1 serine hydrolase [Oceanobacillus sp. 143]
MEQLSHNIERIIKQSSGKWGIAIEELGTNKSWGINEEELFYAASIIKVPIMIAVFAAYENERLSLSDVLELKIEEMVGGSGVLQYLAPGTRLTINDLITLMIIQSDNTATNMLINLIGKENIQQTMKNIGMQKSKFYNKLMTVPANLQGYNEITAQDLTMILKKLAAGKIVSMHACGRMIEIMKKQQLTDCLPAKLPQTDSNIIGNIPEWQLANKTGFVSGVRHDIGIFYVGDRAMATTVLSQDLDDHHSKDAIAEIGLEIYRYLKR